MFSSPKAKHYQSTCHNKKRLENIHFPLDLLYLLFASWFSQTLKVPYQMHQLPFNTVSWLRQVCSFLPSLMIVKNNNSTYYFTDLSPSHCESTFFLRLNCLFRKSTLASSKTRQPFCACPIHHVTHEEMLFSSSLPQTPTHH